MIYLYQWIDPSGKGFVLLKSCEFRLKPHTNTLRSMEQKGSSN